MADQNPTVTRPTTTASLPERIGKVGRTRGAPARATTINQAREAARWAALAGLEKKATRIEVVEVAGRTDYADVLVLMSGTSDRHVAAIARGVEQEMLRHGARCQAAEGLSQGQWALLDFGDVVVHIFQEDWRDIYNLDGLWMDAPRVDVSDLKPRATLVV